MSSPHFVYPTYEELTARLQLCEKTYPNLCSLTSVGTSPEGRELWLMTVTSCETGEASDKPGIWLDGNTHAAELTSSAMCLAACEHLCSGFHKDSKITELLETRVFYILPRISPDGAEYVLQHGAPVRSAPRVWPEDAPEGLRICDVNGDGKVRQMRVEDPAGTWKPCSLDERLLVPRKPGDSEGPFYHLYPEGVFEEGDLDLLPVPPKQFGLDFNRNYPFRWRPESEQQGAGPYPLCNVETRAVVDAFLARPNIAAVVTYHTYCGAILRPFSYQSDQHMLAHDLYVYEELGEMGARETGYPQLSVFHNFLYRDDQTVSGGFDDWVYHQLGVFAFTVELWSIGKAAGLDVKNPANFYFRGERTEDETHAILKWSDEHLGEEGFQPWKRAEHPQLGTVEVGGWNRIGVWQNPPEQFLDEELARNMEFVKKFAASTPLLADPVVRTKALGEELWRLEVVVQNHGYMPTCVSERAEKEGLASPVKIHVTCGAEQELVEGKDITEMGHLKGVSAVHAGLFPDSVYFRGASRSHVGKASWVIRGAGSVSLLVDGGRAGSRRVNVSLS